VDIYRVDIGNAVTYRTAINLVKIYYADINHADIYHLGNYRAAICHSATIASREFVT
jgi:hypothetical protein